MSGRLFVLISLLLFLLTESCAKQDQDELSATGLSKMMSLDSSLVILDVRTPPELEGQYGYLDGSINIPLHELEARLHEMDIYRERVIAVICKLGIRSIKATEFLRSRGFLAKNVEGGIKAFRELEKNVKFPENK